MEIVLIILVILVFVILVLCGRRVSYFGSEGDVDVVYTWVNSNDPKWEFLKNSYLGSFGGRTDNTGKRWTTTKNPWDEVLLSIESVRKYLPWVRNIYVITQRPQRLPEWITKKYGVRHVHHDEIFKDSGNLPTFSSYAIESQMHRIPGLSEMFIYFNDDMYIVNHMKKTDFFQGGRPIVRMSKGLTDMLNDGRMVGSNIFEKSLLRGRGVLGRDIFGIIHQATPVTRGIMGYAEDKYGKVWESVGRNRFRSEEDVVPVYFALNACPRERYIVLKNDGIGELLLLKYQDVDLSNIHMLCINEIGDSDINEIRRKVLKSWGKSE